MFVPINFTRQFCIFFSLMIYIDHLQRYENGGPEVFGEFRIRSCDCSVNSGCRGRASSCAYLVTNYIYSVSAVTICLDARSWVS